MHDWTSNSSTFMLHKQQLAEISQGSLQREMCESAECVFLLKEEDVKWGYTMWLSAWRHWGGSDFFENKWTVLGSPDY